MCTVGEAASRRADRAHRTKFLQGGAGTETAPAPPPPPPTTTTPTTTTHPPTHPTAEPRLLHTHPFPAQPCPGASPASPVHRRCAAGCQRRVEQGADLCGGLVEGLDLKGAVGQARGVGGLGAEGVRDGGDYHGAVLRRQGGGESDAAHATSAWGRRRCAGGAAAWRWHRAQGWRVHAGDASLPASLLPARFLCPRHQAHPSHTEGQLQRRRRGLPGQALAVRLDLVRGRAGEQAAGGGHLRHRHNVGACGAGGGGGVPFVGTLQLRLAPTGCTLQRGGGRAAAHDLLRSTRHETPRCGVACTDACAVPTPSASLPPPGDDRLPGQVAPLQT